MNPNKARLASPPLSPHLQVYRQPLTAVLSISHRLSGLALCLGAVLVALSLIAAGYGRDAYECAHDLWDSLLGRVFVGVLLLCLYFHLCNGVRHLWWDLGRGLAPAQAQRSSWLILAATIALTAATLWLSYGGA